MINNTAAKQPMRWAQRRMVWMVAGLVVLVIAAPVAWWLASPLWIDNTVDEAFPFAQPAGNIPGTQPQAPGMLAPAQEQSAVTDGATLDRDTPGDEWLVVAQGEFQDADSFHQGSGTARIYQQGDERILRLENFSGTNGPDLRVLLVEHTDGANGMGEYVDLGPLKGNIGNQNYTIPVDVDLSKFNGVMIYCQPFHVVFSTALFAR